MSSDSVADLLRANLLDVFNEPDPRRRRVAIARIYAKDVVWHEPDRIIRGRDALDERATELHARNPDWSFQPDGPVSVNDDLGHLNFRYGPAGQPAAVSGMDIARCENGVIAEFYTLITEVRLAQETK
jgi:hypothetical protein